MVKKFFKSVLYFLFFIVSLMYLTPKVNIYYLLEQKLKPFGVIVSKEDLEDTGYNLNIENLHVSYKEIKSLKISKMECNIFAFYNSINIKDIELAKALSSFLPRKIKDVKISYSIVNPLNIFASAKGEFGDLEAEFNLSEFRLHLNLKPSKLMLHSYENTLNNMKKTQNGDYTYDQSF